MSNPTTPFNWQMPTATDLVTDLPADFEVFGQAVATSMADLLGGTTGQVLAKTTNTDMDFSWVTPTDQTPLTTKGDLFTFTTVDARLGVGANDTVLTADSAQATGLKWAAPAALPYVGVRVSKSAVQSITTNTYTVVTWNTEAFDTNTFHDNATNNSRLTIPAGKSGYYNIQGSMSFAGNATGYRRAFSTKNGVLAADVNSQLAGNATSQAQSFAYVAYLTAGDYVEMQIFQSSGGNLNALFGEDSFFAVTYLGA